MSLSSTSGAAASFSSPAGTNDVTRWRANPPYPAKRVSRTKIEVRALARLSSSQHLISISSAIREPYARFLPTQHGQAGASWPGRLALPIFFRGPPPDENSAAVLVVHPRNRMGRAKGHAGCRDLSARDQLECTGMAVRALTNSMSSPGASSSTISSPRSLSRPNLP